jgi:hypothetical protein
MIELRRFTNRLTPDDLPQALVNPGLRETEGLGISVDLSGALHVVEQLATNSEPEGSRLLSSWDQDMVEPLHASFCGVPRRLLLDMHVWHWLCVVPFRTFVLRRWCAATTIDSPEELSASERGRFLGSSSLNGVSRNALARLFWCGETLWSEDRGYELARKALERQDFFQAVFERRFGLYRPAARAAVLKLANTKEQVWRNSLKGLNFCLSTMVIEAMDEESITNLLEEFSA